MAQFDFQIGVEVTKLESLVKTFEKLSKVLAQLTGKSYDLNVNMPNKVLTQLNKVDQTLSNISSKQTNVNLAVNQASVANVAQKTATTFQEEFSKVTRSARFVNETLGQIVSPTSNINAKNLVGTGRGGDLNLPSGRNAGKIPTQFSEVRESFKSTIKEINSGNQSLAQNGRSIEEWGQAISRQRQFIDSTRGALSKYASVVDEQSKVQGKSFTNQKSFIGRTNKELDSLTRTTNEYAKQQELAASAQRRFNNNLIQQAVGQKDVNERLDFAIEKLILYRFAFGAMQKIAQGFTGSISVFAELEQVFADIEKVLNPTAEQLGKIRDTAFDLAKTFAAPVKDVAKSMQIWAQAGLDVNQSIEATRATLLGQNSIGLDAVSITEALTAATFGYKKEVTELTSVIDGWMAVQAKYPLSAADLAGGIKRVGAAGNELGVSLNTLNGYIAAVNATTRKTGNEIGNSLKTVFARIPRDEVVKLLSNLGVASFNTSGELRRLEDIIEDVGVKWATLTNIQKKNIATALGGVHRYVDVLALFSNFSVAQQAAIESEKAFGASMAANQIQLATLNGSVQQLASTFTKLGFELGERLIAPFQALFNIIQGFANFVSNNKGFSRFLAFFAGISVTAIGAVAAFHGLNFAITRMAASLGQIIPGLVKTKTEVGALAAQMAALNAQANAGQSSLTTWAARISKGFSLVTIAIGLIFTAISAFGNTTKKLVDTSNLLTNTFDTQLQAIKNVSQGYVKEIKFLNETSKRREEIIALMEKENKGTEKQRALQDELKAVNEALSKVSIDLQAALTGVGGSLELAKTGQEKYKKALEDTIEAENELLGIQKTKLQLLFAQFSGKDRDATLKNIQEQNNLLVAQRDIVFNSAKAFSVLQKGVSAAVLESVGDLEKFQSILIKALNFGKSGLVSKIDIGSLFADGLLGSNETVRTAFRTTVNRVIEPEVQKEIGALKRNIQLTGDFRNMPKDQQDEIIGFFDSWSDSVDNLDEVLLGVAAKSKDLGEFKTGFLSVMSNSFLQGEAIVKQFSDKALQDLEALASKMGNINLAQKLLDPLKNEFDLTKLFDPETKDGIIPAKAFATDVANKYLDKLKEIERKYIETPALLEKQRVILKGLGSEAGKLTTDLGNLAEGIVKDQTGIISDIDIEISDFNEKISQMAKRSGREWEDIAAKFSQTLNFEQDRTSEVDERTKKYQREISKLEELKIVAEGLGADSKNISLLSQWIKDAVALRKRMKEIALESERFEQSINIQTQSLKEANVKEKEINSSLLQQYDIRLKNLFLQRKTTDELSEQEILDTQIKDTLKEISNLKFQQKLIDWKEENKNLLRFKDNLQSALTDGLGTITDVFVNERQTRVDLTKDILDKEKELAEARKDGDQQGIIQAQKDLENLNKELGKHVFILREVANVFGNVFKSIADAVLKQQLEDFAKNISGLIKVKPLEVKEVEISADKFSQQVSSSASEITSAGDHFYNKVSDAAGIISQAIQTSQNNPIVSGNPMINASIGVNQMKGMTNAIKDAQSGNAFRSTGTRQENIDSGIAKAAKEAGDKQVEAAVSFKEIIRQAAGIFSNAMSVALASAFGGGANSIQGASIGNTLGQLVSQLKMFGGGGNPFITALMGLGGGILGGIIGNIFDTDEDNTVATIDNTSAIQANTNALEELGRQVINATTRFRLPALSGGVVSGGISIGSVVIQSNQNGEQVYKQFKEAIERDYGNNVSTGYTRSRMISG